MQNPVKYTYHSSTSQIPQPNNGQGQGYRVPQLYQYNLGYSGNNSNSGTANQGGHSGGGHGHNNGGHGHSNVGQGTTGYNFSQYYQNNNYAPNSNYPNPDEQLL